MKKSAYEQAGVSIDRGNEAVERIKSMVKRMGVQEIGKFGGFFPLKGGIKNPILVSSADGVGTKLKVAFLTGVHNTVGRDLVNHCVNDILVYGARPLFFLDYLASGRVEPKIVGEVISGVLDGCLDNEMVLLGGETAEMPGFYQEGEYDIAGFIVGIVGRENVVDGKTIRKGDLLVGLPSTGLHTNGYSLARHIVFEKLNLKVSSKVSELAAPIGEELLRVHRSYLKPVQAAARGKAAQGHGPHHRRRAAGEHPAHPAGRRPPWSSRRPGPCRRSFPSWSRPAASRRPSATGCSTWASAWCWSSSPETSPASRRSCRRSGRNTT